MPDVEKITTYHLTDAGWERIKEFSENACRAEGVRQERVYEDMRAHINRMVENATKSAKFNGFKKGKAEKVND